MSRLRGLLARDPLRALTANQLMLLDQIRTRKRPMTVSEAADRLELSLSQTSRIAKSLIDLGFVERRWDPDDARRHTLSTTRKGEAIGLRVQDYVAANGDAR